VAQQAALYRPVKNQGVFGSLGGDLLSAIKDPYFHKFAAAAAAMAGGAALAAQSAGGAAGGTGVGTAAGGTGGTGISSAAGGLGLKMPTATSLASMGGGTGLIVPAGTNALSVGALGAGGLGTLGAGGLGNITAKQALSAARLALPAIRAIAGAGGDSNSAANQRRLANQLSGGNQGGVANQVQVKSSPLTKIDYLYDIGGESIFAPMREKKLPDSDIGLYADGGLVSFNEGGDVTQEELEAALRPVTYNSRIAASGETSRRNKEEALARQQQGPEDTVVDEYGNVIRFSDYGRAAPTLEETVQQLTGMEPGVERSIFLPYSKEAGVHVPEIIYGGIKSILSPEQARKYGNVTGKEGVETAMNLMGGALGVSSGMRNPTGIERGVDLGMQIGPNAAKYWDKSLAQLAQNALDAGVDPSRLKQMTGTEQFPMYKNMDTKLQEQITGPWENVGFQEVPSNPFGSRLYQEISDKDAVYNPRGSVLKNVVNAIKSDSAPQMLPDVLKHPKLYEAYPELKNTPVRFYKSKTSEYGSFNPQTGVISINKNIPIKDQLDTILHEVQHSIQKKEGWSGGSNPDNYITEALHKLPNNEYGLLLTDAPADDLLMRYTQQKILDKVKLEAHKMYQRNQGEASARAVPNRRNLDDQQIRTTPTKYDIPESEITQYANGGLIGYDDMQTIDDLYEMLRSK
jgi:hypothetical protein